MGCSKVALWLAGSAATAMTMACVAGCGLLLPPKCAGLCALLVAFKAGAEPHSARATVAACEPNPDIIRVGAVRVTRWPPGRVPGLRPRRRLVATIFVRSMRPTGKALTHVNCLSNQPGVLDIGGQNGAPIKGIG